MLFFYEKIKQRVYNDQGVTRTRLERLSKLHTSKESYCSVLSQITDISDTIDFQYKSYIGVNALVQLCGYPSSTQNIDDMIANKYFI